MIEGKKILIVDDELSYRTFLRRLFERHGCAVETSASGLVSLDIAAENPPDVLIVDWMLRDSVDGLQVAAEMRNRVPGLKTVLTTGFPATDIERKAAAQPCTTYLAKPFDAEEILAVVGDAVSGDG